MSDKKLVIVGDGEFGTIAYEYFTHDSEYEVVGFSVEREFITREKHCDLDVVPFEDLSSHFSPSEVSVYVAVTNPKLNRVRTRLYFETKEKGYSLATYISSKAFIWRNVEIGENTFIFENNVLQPFTKIGNNVVLWSGNHIGHRTTVGDNCFLSSHIVISGYCTVGENSFLGVNASVANNVNIASDNFVAMSAAIIKDTEENSVYKGVPAKKSDISALKFCKVDNES